MTFGTSAFLPTIICVAGLSFLAGRAATGLREDSVSEIPAIAIAEVKVPESFVTSAVPTLVPDMIALPFVDAYRILKLAPPETIRSYYKQLEQLPLGPVRNAAMTAFFKILIQVNPSLTRDLIVHLKKDDRWLPLSAIREAATPRGMETVAEVLLSFDRIEISGCSYDLLRESLDEWGKTDPLALKQFLETHRGQDVERYFDKLVSNWAALDPEAAREWMAQELEKRPLIPTRPTEDGGEEIFDSEWRSAVEEMSVAWVQGFLTNDPDAAGQYVLDHLDNERVKKALFWLAGDLFTMSRQRAYDFILALPEDLQSRSLDSVGRKANALVRDADDDNNTAPRYIAEWMMRFPAEAWREGIRGVLNNWEQSNPKELFAWMAKLPPPTREIVVREFTSYVSADHAQEDFDSIMQAEDRVLRDQLLEKLMRNAKDARTEVLGVLDRAQIPPAQRLHLASLIPPKDDNEVSERNHE